MVADLIPVGSVCQRNRLNQRKGKRAFNLRRCLLHRQQKRDIPTRFRVGYRTSDMAMQGADEDLQVMKGRANFWRCPRLRTPLKQVSKSKMVPPPPMMPTFLTDTTAQKSKLPHLSVILHLHRFRPLSQQYRSRPQGLSRLLTSTLFHMMQFHKENALQ